MTVGQRRLDVAEALANAQIELVRIGHLRLVGRTQTDAAGKAKARRHRSAAHRDRGKYGLAATRWRRHSDMDPATVCANRNNHICVLVLFDHALDEQVAVIVAASAAEEDEVAVAMHVIGHAEARLNAP